MISYIKKYNDEMSNTEKTTMSKAKSSIEEHVAVTSTSNVRDVIDEYLVNFEDDEEAMYRLSAHNTESDDVCGCGGTYRFDPAEAALLCLKCGSSRQHLEVSMRNLNYDDERGLTAKRRFTYKRLTHFIETLTTAQGKIQKKVPQEIMDIMTNEMKKIRITKETLNETHVRNFLKKHEKSKFYDSVQYVLNTIRGYNELEIPEYIENELIRLFVKIQQTFDRLEKERTNFLRYTYVIYKLLEITDHDVYIHLFPLLKSAEKIQQHDQMWKLICMEHGWVYTPTR